MGNTSQRKVQQRLMGARSLIGAIFACLLQATVHRPRAFHLIVPIMAVLLLVTECDRELSPLTRPLSRSIHRFMLPTMVSAMLWTPAVRSAPGASILVMMIAT